jgi:predicted nucleic acid-binding protein
VIVVDANVIAYAVIPGAQTEAALAAIERDPEWIAPPLWRSEFRNILASSMRTKRLTLGQALAAFEHAARIVAETTLDIDCEQILKLSAQSGASAYDCEYVALAEVLSARFVTADRALARRFSKVAIGLDRFADPKLDTSTK